MRAFSPEVDKSDILSRLSLTPKSYILVTAHRSENVDNPEYLGNIFTAIGRLAKHFTKRVIYPMHPRTKSKLKDITIPECAPIMALLGFSAFHHLLPDSFSFLSLS